jgi:hypothetical protein
MSLKAAVKLAKLTQIPPQDRRPFRGRRDPNAQAMDLSLQNTLKYPASTRSSVHDPVGTAN